MREAEVTAARPQRYCATAIPASSEYARGLGSTAPTDHVNAPAPRDAAWSTSGIATTTAHNRSHPKRPETATACTMPRGTVTAAPTVSSDAFADASKPVIVYAGRRKLSAKSSHALSVAGHTSPPPAPL